MTQRRTRHSLLIEYDTPENCPDMMVIAESNKLHQQLALKLRLLPSPEFQYVEDLDSILVERDCRDAEIRGAESASPTINIFAQDFDTMTLETLYKLLESIDCDEVDRQRQLRDMQRRPEEAPVDEVELYLDMAFKEEGDEYSKSDVAHRENNSSSGADDTSAGTSSFGIAGDSSPLHSGDSGFNAALSSNVSRGYTYTEMTQRIFRMLGENNEGSARAERNKIPMPKLETVGKKKTCINNFTRICDEIRRPVEDVKEFVEKELTCKGNLDTKGALTVRFQMQKSTDLDNLLQRYLDMYVKCNSCNRIDTTLQKSGRLSELRCNLCHATRSVSAVASTYTANMEKRSRARATMTL